MILVDTNIWVQSFKKGTDSNQLAALLEQTKVACHPWIYGELLVGDLGKERVRILTNLSKLPMLAVNHMSDLQLFIEKTKLYGKGLSIIDIQILYSSLIEDCLVWTRDKNLYKVLNNFGKIYQPIIH